MQQCGFCSMLSDLLRKAMCIRSRRGSSESYYRELGDQETLKIDDRSSVFSDDSEDINQEAPVVITRVEVNEVRVVAKRSKGTGRFLTIHKRRKKRLVTRSLRLDAALLDDLQHGQVQCVLRQSVTWRFNAFTLENVSGGRCLSVLCVHLFQMYGLISYFKLDIVKTWKLFNMFEAGYHSSNPYHNSIHAADVTQAMHCFLQQKQIFDHLEPIEIMASLLAAIAHDLDHPGVNQPFLIATSNHLAALYENTSVLENHHWRVAVSCLIESELLDYDIRVQVVQQISSLIMATDITRQQEFLNQFKIPRNSTRSEWSKRRCKVDLHLSDNQTYMDTNTLDMRKREHRQLVLQIALKCADISNPCRPWEISKKWSLKVCEEFFRQGDYERKLNLPVTALCDRLTTSIPKIQTGFLKYVVTPLVTEWHRFLQNDLSVQMIENLLYNQAKWDELVAIEIAEDTKTEISEPDLIDDDLETYSGTNISDSSELLLPLRRSSLNPTKTIGIKEQLRRFSVPLNLFQDTRFKNKEKSRDALAAESRIQVNAGIKESEHSIHSQLSLHDQSAFNDDAEKAISTEKLLPDTSIASITTPVQATRLSTVIKDKSTWKLIRQQTFPPLETVARSHALLCRPKYTSNEEGIYSVRCVPDIKLSFEADIEKRISNFFRKNRTENNSTDDASETCNVDATGDTGTGKRQKENFTSIVIPSKEANRRDMSTVGSQLRDNLSTVKLNSSEELAGRRKSMPTDAVTYATKEKKMLEVIPQLLRRTLSNKDYWSNRRGSAPAPVAPSELRGLASLGALRHSVNGGKRKPGPLGTCQQWLTKTTYGAQERTPHLSRRASLPVEVFNVSETQQDDN